MNTTKTYDELTISDNFLFQRVMRNQRLCQHLISSILGITIARIYMPQEEKQLKADRDSKGVRLDVYVEDENGVLYDIEIQTADNANPQELPKRARYYQAMMDMDVLQPGAPYTKLRKTYIIFICTFDPIGLGRRRYTFQQYCVEDKGIGLQDETTRIFLNSQGSGDEIPEDLANFLEYVDGHAAKGKFTEAVDAEFRRVKAHKETKVEFMTIRMEIEIAKAKAREEAREEGRAEGERAQALETARVGLQKHVPLSLIQAMSGLSEEEIRKVAAAEQLDVKEG